MHVNSKPVITCSVLCIFSALLSHVYAAGTEPKSTRSQRQVQGPLAANTSLKERSDAQTAVVHARAAFVFPSPDETTEILKLLKKGEEVNLLDKKVDDLDRLWYLLRDPAGDTGWVESHDLKIITGTADSGNGKPPGKGGREPATISKLSKKTRLHYVKNHPGLDRRTRKLIKDGFVGMGMTEKDVRASLGDPDAERKVVLLKRGEMHIWIYHPEKPVIIAFEGGKVTGWSKE